ncbi:hypothetical protein KP79_PYT18685 [Mizuhopecten yessoensis]|uniref:Uncharacterized protein n=1 Tax=Mizuhopecten yessoensis TaxID=6573 RepID=A0A210R698_MIZYE|nr:hypothetical protein KP79_PYT18685 [Mizuhopecten yessoensis]
MLLMSSNNSSMDSYSVSGIEQLTPRKLVDVMDTEVMAPPSGSRVTHGQQGTVQINLPDISKLSPSVSRNLNSSPNCSQDLFNLTDFSCVEKINFTISTPTPCRTCNHQMSCRSDHSMSTPISNSNQHRLNNCGPVQETPCTTEMQANCHRPVIDEKSLTESPHSVLHYNESLNLTGNQSVTEFGNFQIESSILRNMDRSHQVSADQSQDISSLGDLSHNYSSSLGKNETQNQDIVLQKFETKGQPPDAFLKKTCVSDHSHLLSTDTECKEVQGHHYPGYRDQEECLAGCVHSGADGHEDASYNTRLDGNNKGSMSCSPQYTAKSPDSQSNPGHHSSGYTSMDDSVAFKLVDSKGDHLPSTENVKGDRVKLQGLASLTTHRTASLLDIGGKHRNKPDVRSESHTNYPQCTSGHLVSKYSSEPASTAQCTVRAGNRHTDTLDRRLEGKLTSHVASVSVPLPSIKQVTDELLIGKDSVISTSSYTPVVKNVSDRTSPDLHKEHARPVVNKVISVSVDIDHSPVALADRLRARLRKASDHSVLGDIRDNRHNIGTIGSDKQERTTILID